MRRRAAVFAALIGSSASVSVGGPTLTTTDGSAFGSRVAASFPVADRFDPTPRPLGAVTVIGDSVLYGSVVFDPHIGTRLGAHGWGPVRVRGGGSYTTGHFAVGDQTRASYWIDVWQSQGWDAPNVIVNLGTNDSGLCRNDLACARAAILHVVDAIGPGRRVWWPMITRRPVDQRYADNWNLALAQIADERDDFFTWDWPAVMRAEGLRAGDNIHLDPAGYRRRSELIAAEFTRVLARASRTGGDAPLPEPTGPPSEFVPLGPIRVGDTRSDGSRLAVGGSTTFDLAAHMPSGAAAAAVYVTAASPDDRGFLTVWGCESPRPMASTVNYEAGRNRGAMTIAALSPDGELCVHSRVATDVVVDLQGAFVPIDEGGADIDGDIASALEPTDEVEAGRDVRAVSAASGGRSFGMRFDPLTTPVRLLDTRDGATTTAGVPVEIPIDVTPGPIGAAAVSISAIAGDEPGFVTAYDCDDPAPTVATLNHGAHEIVAGAAFVPVGPNRAICVVTRADIDLTVDLTGVFSADGALVHVPVPPTRMIDTRDATGGWEPIHGADQTIDARVAPAGVAAVTGTLILVEPTGAAHLRAWGCGERPPTASVNAGDGQVLANAVTTGVSPDGRLCVYARTGGSTVFDLTGWWTAAP